MLVVAETAVALLTLDPPISAALLERRSRALSLCAAMTRRPCFGGVCRSHVFLSVFWIENRLRASEEPLRPNGSA